MLAPLWSFVLAAIVAAGVGGYVKGCSDKGEELDALRARQAQAEELRKETDRLRERALTIANEGVAHAHALEKKRLAAVAVAANNRLRELESTLSAVASATAPAAPGPDDPRDGIIRECASALVVLDSEAQSLRGTVAGLQRFAREVCLATLD